VNINVGVLGAESGCLAKDWIKFDWEKVYWREKVVDIEIMEALEATGKK
jgi:hypothetical protein